MYHLVDINQHVIIPQGTVDNNLGLDRLSGTKALSQLVQTTNPLISRPLSGSPKCIWYLVELVGGQGIPSTHTINVAHLT